MDFRQAIASAQELLQQADASADALTCEMLLPFFQTEEAARGFFVSFLTGTWSFADQPPAGLLAVLRKSQSPSFSLLARNLVMSSATEAAHLRSGDLEKAKMSGLVSARTAALIAALNEPLLFQMLADMKESLLGSSTAFAEFLARVPYSDDEKLAALAAVEKALSRQPVSSKQYVDLDLPLQ